MLRTLATALLFTLALAHPATAQDAEKTPLGMRMSAMNDALKLITAQVEDSSKNASTLEQVIVFKSNATEALTFKPEKTAGVPEAEQEQFVLDFQAGIKSLLVTVDSLEAAVKAGRNADAVAIIDNMKKLQREKHGVFRIRKGSGS
jgi:soluble cytochrome b562